MANERLWTGRWECALRERPAPEGLIAQMRSAGFGEIAARVAVGRLSDDALRLAAPTLRSMQHYAALPDIDVAAERVALAIEQGQKIAIFVDYDTDGSTAGAILTEALITLFGALRENVCLLIGHRLKDGYGLTDAVADRILAESPQPKLLITADAGSADEQRIARLKAHHIDTVVCDHHEIPKGNPPKSAYAFVSPKREGSLYDPDIAGCMVAFLLAAAVRNVLVDKRYMAPEACDLRGILEFAALGSLADCVDIGRSETNRAVIRSGLRRMNEGTRPCWRVASRRMGQNNIVRITSTDLIFGVVPRINAHSRIDEAMPGFRYLTSANDAEASRWYDLLDAANNERKAIERQMAQAALAIGEQQVAEGRHGLVVWLEQGHPGVQGIVASRLVERFARPAVCLSPHSMRDGLCQGSLRSVQGYSVSNGLDWIRQHDGVLIAGGGHAMAGGVTIARESLERFASLFEQSARQALAGQELLSVIEHDGKLQCADLSPALLDELASIEPFGNGFARPVFLIEHAVVDGARSVGKDGVHLKLLLRQRAARAEAIWFFARTDRQSAWPVTQGERRSFVIEPQANWYRGTARVQAKVVGLCANEPV